MLKIVLSNKKMLILVVAVVLVLVGTLIVVLTRDDSGKDGKPGISIGTDKDIASESSKDDTDDVYNEDGLEVEDTLDESVYTIDGSGDWDGNFDDSKKEQDDAQSDDTKSDDTQSDDTKKEESNDKGNDADEELDKDILVDDKVWGEIS